MILGAKKMQFSGFQPPSVTKHVRLAAAQVVVQGSLDWSSGKIYWKPFFPMKHKGFHFPFHQSIEWFMNLWCSMFRVLLILNMSNLSVKDLDIAHQTFQFYNKNGTEFTTCWVDERPQPAFLVLKPGCQGFNHTQETHTYICINIHIFRHISP